MVNATRRQREHYNRGRVRILSGLSFVLGFLDAFFIYQIAIYFAALVGETQVGWFYFLIYAIVFVALFNLRRFLQRVGAVYGLLLCFGIALLAAAFLSRLPISFAGAALVIVFFVVTNISWVILDTILENYSQDRVSGRVRGLYLTVMNAGLLCAPYISSSVAAQSGFNGLFFWLLVGFSLVLIATVLLFRDAACHPVSDVKMGSALRRLMKDRDLSAIYHISFAMEMFYAIMIVYTTLHLVRLGLAEGERGLIFTIMLFPFVLLQYPLGALADKRLGEKEMLFGATLIVIAATLAFAFTDSRSVLVLGALLFFTRVGIAAIEVLRDSYFYKQIDGNDLDLIALFRTARPLANVTGHLLSIGILLFVPLPGMFLFVAIVLFTALFSIIRLKDTESVREQGRAAQNASL